MTRREFIMASTAVAIATQLRGSLQASESEAIRIGMCDWNLGKTGKIEALELASKIGLDGVQVSILFPAPGKHLRDPEMQRRYLEVARKCNVAICSTALGVLNGVPLKSEPKAALWVADAIEVTRKLGCKVILLAFFGKGTLHPNNEVEMKRVIDVLKELAPRAEKAGVILGLENTLSAEDNMRIIDAVGSPAVRVYYDFKNSANAGRDVPKEIRMLKDLICEVHIKNGNKFLSQRTNVDFPACARALREIGYRGWYVLETSSPSGDLIADTRKNIEYVRKVFGA